MAVLLPIPEEAPVMTMVLPSRRLDIAEEAMVRSVWEIGLRTGLGVLRAVSVRRNLLLVRRACIRDGFGVKVGYILTGVEELVVD